MIYYPENFGAKADGKNKDTGFIQAAIDEAFKNGGGKVVFSSGRVYYSGGIQIKSGVELHFEIGSKLLASVDLEDYISPAALAGSTPEDYDFARDKTAYAFIYGFEAHRCALTGLGSVDGNCMAFVEKTNEYHYAGKYYPRPAMIYIENSRHITFDSVTLEGAPFWTLHPAGCYDVQISGIRILNRLDVANSDGIDPDHCKNVRITGCHIECADDCIVLKNTMGNKEYGSCENILIDNCTLVSTSAAIKIGTEGVDDFRNIQVSNCVISRSNRGISLQIRDNGNVENVSFSNIMIETRRFSDDWWGCGEPVAITSINRRSGITSGRIEDIRFKNIFCTGENGILIAADAEGKIGKLFFEDVKITIKNTTKWEKGVYDLRPSGGVIKSDLPVYTENVTVDVRGIETVDS